MLERHKLLMGRTQACAGHNNGSIGVFWRSFNGIIDHIHCMFACLERVLGNRIERRIVRRNVQRIALAMC